MNKKWYIHERFTPVHTEILGSDFVSLAMCRGLSDDFRCGGRAAQTFFFLRRKQMSWYLSGQAGQADEVKVCALLMPQGHWESKSFS